MTDPRYIAVEDLQDWLELLIAAHARPMPGASELQIRDEIAHKLEKVASGYEAGGHSHRAQMLRALATEIRAEHADSDAK